MFSVLYFMSVNIGIELSKDWFARSGIVLLLFCVPSLIEGKLALLFINYPISELGGTINCIPVQRFFDLEKQL